MWEQITSATFDILVPVLSLFVMWGARKAILFVERKLDMDVSKKQEDMLAAWLMLGIAFAEEKARAAVKAKTAKIESSKKLELAVNFVLNTAKENGWDHLAKDAIEARIEALLNIARPDAPEKDS